eukprot:jgi/Galph1/5737/GphlegSOOS_G4343.1
MGCFRLMFQCTRKNEHLKACKTEKHTRKHSCRAMQALTRISRYFQRKKTCDVYEKPTTTSLKNEAKIVRMVVSTWNNMRQARIWMDKGNESRQFDHVLRAPNDSHLIVHPSMTQPDEQRNDFIHYKTESTAMHSENIQPEYDKTVSGNSQESKPPQEEPHIPSESSTCAHVEPSLKFDMPQETSIHEQVKEKQSEQVADDEGAKTREIHNVGSDIETKEVNRVGDEPVEQNETQSSVEMVSDTHNKINCQSEENNVTRKLSKKQNDKQELDTTTYPESETKAQTYRKETIQTEDDKRQNRKTSTEALDNVISSNTRTACQESENVEYPSQSESISETELHKESTEWSSILATLETDWNHRVAALKHIRLVVKRALNSSCQNVTEVFSNSHLRNALILQTSDLRSSLVKETFETIAVVSQALGPKSEFWTTCALFLEKAVLSGVVKTTKVIAKPAEDCGKRIVSATEAEAVLPVLCSTVRFGTHPVAREKATLLILHILKRGSPLVRSPEQVSIVAAQQRMQETIEKDGRGLQYSISEFTNEESGLRSLESALASSIADSHAATRELGLACLSEMEKHWPERTEHLVKTLDPSLRRRAISTLSSTSSSYSAFSSAASSNKPRKSVKELRAEARRSKYELEHTKVWPSTSIAVAEIAVAEASFGDVIEKVSVGREDPMEVSTSKTVCDSTEKVTGSETRTSRRAEASVNEVRNFRNRDPLRMR